MSGNAQCARLGLYLSAGLKVCCLQTIRMATGQMPHDGGFLGW